MPCVQTDKFFTITFADFKLHVFYVRHVLPLLSISLCPPIEHRPTGIKFSFIVLLLRIPICFRAEKNVIFSVRAVICAAEVTEGKIISIVINSEV